MKGVTAVWVARNRYAALDSSGKLLVKSSSHEVRVNFRKFVIFTIILGNSSFLQEF